MSHSSDKPVRSRLLLARAGKNRESSAIVTLKMLSVALLAFQSTRFVPKQVVLSGSQQNKSEWVLRPRLQYRPTAGASAPAFSLSFLSTSAQLYGCLPSKYIRLDPR